MRWKTVNRMSKKENIGFKGIKLAVYQTIFLIGENGLNKALFTPNSLIFINGTFVLGN